MTFETHSHASEGLRASEPFVSGHGRATAVVVLFAAYICVSVSSIVSNLMQIGLLSEAVSGGITTEQAEANDMRQLAVNVILILIFVALAVAFLVWLHRVMKNLPALGNPKTRIEYTPGWAVGSFFIPFANLFMPYRAVSEAWNKSNPLVRTEEGLTFAPRSTSGLLTAWWVSWIAFGIVGRVASKLESSAKAPETFIHVTWVMIVADALAILSGVLAILVVRGLDRRQEERSRNVTYAPHTPPPPPLFTPPPPRPQV